MHDRLLIAEWKPAYRPWQLDGWQWQIRKTKRTQWPHKPMPARNAANAVIHALSHPDLIRKPSIPIKPRYVEFTGSSPTVTFGAGLSYPELQYKAFSRSLVRA